VWYYFDYNGILIEDYILRHLAGCKRAIFWITFSTVVFLFCNPATAEIGKWKVTKSTHFIIYYLSASREYVHQVAREAEYHYTNITEQLGFNRFDFWLWENRCKIYLYDTKEDYQGGTGVASWSRGRVNVLRKEISSYLWQDEFFDAILPHEMGHIIFRELIGFDKSIPLWLDEGIACAQEKDIQERLKVAKFLVTLNLYIPLEDFSNLNKTDLVMPFIFYNEAASIMNFVLNDFSKDLFVSFCRRLRDNNTGWKEEFLSVYKLKDFKELEQKWVEYYKQDKKP